MTELVKEDAHRKAIDQIAGYWSSFILNLILIVLALGVMADGDAISETPLAWLPWLFNGVIIAVSLFLYPAFATGYLIALAVIAGAALIYMPSCIATCLVATAIGIEPALPYSGSSLDYWFWPAFAFLYIILWALGGLFFSFRHYRKAAENEQQSILAGADG